MSRAIRIHETGGPEVMKWEEVTIGDPAPDEVLVRHTAIGLNYIDTYHRSGLYPVQLPLVLGGEGAGVVEKVGSAVKDIKAGDRVTYVDRFNSYAEQRLVHATRAIKIPDGIDDATAAAMMLKGMTARYLLRALHVVKPGQTILFHAAAGGVGLIACQWANALGATVIGTVGSEAKAKLARENGCHHVIDYTKEDFVARVKDITGGAGVPVVYDSVGKDTYEGSLNCLSKRGLWVLFGQSSGPVPPFNLGRLTNGSLYVTRPTLVDYTATREDLMETANDLFGMVKAGKVKIHIGQEFPLAKAADAHRALEGRKTVGATVLRP